MKRALLGIALLALSLCIENSFHGLAACGDTWQKAGDDTSSPSCAIRYDTVTLIQYTKHWKLFWVDG